MARKVNDATEVVYGNLPGGIIRPAGCCQATQERGPRCARSHLINATTLMESIIMPETASEYNERRAMVEEQLRESLDYEYELAEEIEQELQTGFDEFCRTAEYLMKKQKAKLQDIDDRREFDDVAYQEEQWEDYRMINRDDVEQPLRESYEESFRQKVEEAMA